MDVYLIPLGADAYVLYCETQTAADAHDPAPTSWIDRLISKARATFHRAVEEGESVETDAAPGHAPGKFRRAFTRKLADAVAEQRLLWHLRRETAACLIHPDDMAPDTATTISQRLLAADRDRHRRWAIVDGVVVLLCAPAALLPGPNVLAYYFIFRTVGHYLSMQGASQALTAIAWSTRPTSELSGLRRALSAAGHERTRRIEHAAHALGLRRLRLFVERVANGSLS